MPTQTSFLARIATRTIVAAALATAPQHLSAQSPPLARPTPDEQIAQRADSILRTMTLEEKAGLMTQVDIAYVTRVPGTSTVAQQLDSAKLHDLLINRHVGSLLNVAGVALTPTQWRDLTGMVQRFAARRRTHIPVLYGIDAVHGHQYMLGATIFPQNIAMAATWNPMLVRRENEITAWETHASGIFWNFSPVLDVARQPLWSRVFETFGEDTWLATVMGREAILANQRNPSSAIDALLQGRALAMLGDATPTEASRCSSTPASSRALTPAPGDASTRASTPARATATNLGPSSSELRPNTERSAFQSTVCQDDLYIAATAKHFLGYSMPLSGHDRTAAWIPDRQLREIFLPPFREAIANGVRTVMINSSEINGVPVHANRAIVTDLLRTELGFTGVVISDYDDILRLQTAHHVAATRRDAVRMALDAGIDMSMQPGEPTFIDDILSLVHAGLVPESRIDESARRILHLELELGIFEHPGADTTALATAGNAAFRAVSQRAAEEAITLLKNDRALLPLARNTRILVTGPGATSRPAMHGGWTYTWQGTDSTMYPASDPTLLDAIRTEFGAARVTHAIGARLYPLKGDTRAANAARAAADRAQAVAASYDADVIVVALAEPPSAEKPGDIDDLEMPEEQLALAKAMEATGKPVIITLFESRPRTIRPIVDSARAIIQAYQTGPYGGVAIARVLSGAVNPSGRLPYTYPRDAAFIEHYDHTASAEATAFRPTGGYNPEWEFGAGLSYTTFAFDSLRVARNTVHVRDTIVVSVAITNSGTRGGMEVVPVYVRQLVASVSPPVRKLRDFTKVALAPGERRTLTFRIPVQRLAFVGRDDRLGVEPGEFELQVGGRTLRFAVE